MPSLISYILLILIVKKLDKGLYFYIDFRRLIIIIKTDYYIFPLTNKLL